MVAGVMNGHPNANYAISRIWTKFRRTKFFVGQNFRRTKLFDGQNFRHRAKISTLLSGEFLSDKVLYKNSEFVQISEIDDKNMIFVLIVRG